jgi:outer membrane receptor protein involved in Fe transport
VSSYTTVDAGMSFSVDRKDGSGLLAGTRFSIDVSNVFDRAPPYVYDAGLRSNYDPANANALQRAVSVTITKSF